MDVAVIGAGSWGTALATVLAGKGDRTALWGRSAGQMKEIAERRENARYLPGCTLPERLFAEPEVSRALAKKPFVVSVVPSHTVRQVWKQAASALDPEAVVISASKGIENETLASMDEVLKEILPGRTGSRLTFLSGPSFAKEVATGLPTAVVIA